jgi:hypothetical protein
MDDERLRVLDVRKQSSEFGLVTQLSAGIVVLHQSKRNHPTVAADKVLGGIVMGFV